MDKLSVRVLKHIHKGGDFLHESDVYRKFGYPALSSLKFLCKTGYISSSEHNRVRYNQGSKLHPNYVADCVYTIEPPGKAFLQHWFWNTFDPWLTRVLAIWGAITGTLALILR